MKCRIELFNNFAGLSLSIFSPLILYPYLSRELSINDFGLFLYAMAITSFLLSATDFGVNITIPKAIAEEKKGEYRRANIIANTVLLKVVSYGACGMILNIAMIALGRYDIWLAVLALIFGLASALVPTWYFIAVGKSGFLTLYTGAVKFLTVCGVIYIPIDKNGPAKIFFFYAIMLVLSNFFLYYMIFRDECRQSWRFSLKGAYKLFKKNSKIAYAMVFVSAYTSLNPILLGFVSSYKEVAIYSAIEKIYKSIEAVACSALNVFYPNVLKEVLDHGDRKKPVLLSLIKGSLSIFILLIALSYLWGQEFFSAYYGAKLEIPYQAIYIMSMVPLFGVLSVIWGNFVMAPLGLHDSYLKFVIWASGISLIVLIVCNKFTSGAVAAAAAALSTSIFMFICMRYRAQSVWL